MKEKSIRTYGNFETSSNDPDAHKRVMELLDKKDASEWLKTYYERHAFIEKMVIEKYHPEHKDHTQEEVDAETMYGLFLFKTMKCSCGAKFGLDRDMFVLDEKMKERLK